MKKLWIIGLIVLLILPASVQGEELSQWYAWAYAEAADTLLLFNREGDILEMNVPTDPQADPEAPGFIGVSRQGNLMAVVTFATDNSPLVIFHDLNSGAQTSWKGTPDEAILTNLDGSYTIPSITFSEDGGLFALGLTKFDNTWRVVIFFTSTGQPATEITQNYDYLQGIMAQTGQFVLPVVRLFDARGVHVQLVQETTEGETEYPSFLWQWDGTVIPSDYVDAEMDIDPRSGAVVNPAVDETSDMPAPIGPSAAYNAIDMTTSDTMLVITDELVTRTRWANGTDAVLFETQNPDTFETLWNVVRLDDPDAPSDILEDEYADVRGTPNGFLSVEEFSGVIRFHSVEDPYNPEDITTIQTGDGIVEIIWVLPDGYEYLGPQ